MRGIRLTKEDTGKGYLILVTPRFPIACNIDAGKMDPVTAQKASSANIMLETKAAGMLNRLLTKIESGDRIVPVSGYRSHEEQIRIWEDTLKTDGEEFTRTFVAKPGHSEHETGLAIDLAENREEIDFICPAFPSDGICGRFRELAPSFGFTERYPAGKEGITGIGAEPWHFRYVGRPHAEVMKREGLILEEYIAFLREETSLQSPYQYSGTEISYIDMREKKSMWIRFPKQTGYCISGTNEGGLVLCQSPGFGTIPAAGEQRI